MSLVITVAQLKGGVGRTTTAVALAEAAAAGARVVLLDSDPMGGAVRWSVLADQAGMPLAATVVGMPASDLPRRIAAISRDADVIVIDSPPPGALQIARGAIEAASVVVMPASPAMADLDRARVTAEEVGRGIPARVVLTMTRPYADTIAARAALAAWRIRMFAAELPLTVQVARNYGRPPSGVLARFGDELLSEVLDAVDGG